MPNLREVFNPTPADPACYDLARHFLEADATEAQKLELAGKIQDTCEDYLRDLEERNKLVEFVSGILTPPKETKHGG